MPSVGSTRPSSRRASVVLPEPLSPTTAMTEGRSASIARDRPASASVPSRPSPPPKRLPTSTASISGGIASYQVTGDLRAGDVTQHGAFGAAAIHRQLAARMEGAARWQFAQGAGEAREAG